MASLADVIASKEWADRPKDHEALSELRELRRAQIAVEQERRRPSRGSGQSHPGRPTRPAPGLISRHSPGPGLRQGRSVCGRMAMASPSSQ